MALFDKLQEAYLLRAKETFDKNKHSPSRDDSWFENVLRDFARAEANEELAELAGISTYKTLAFLNPLLPKKII